MTAGRDDDHAGIADRLSRAEAEELDGIGDRMATEMAAEMVSELSLKPADEPADEPMPTMSEQIAEQLGGMRGLIESSVPVLAFVLLNAVLSNNRLDLVADKRVALYWAIGGAVGTAVVIAIYRLTRREPVRHAVNGLVGIALGAYLAARSGQAKDFYLPGILLTLGQAAILLVSVGFRKPIIGYVWAVMANRGQHDWLTKPGMLKMFQWLTVAWAISLIVRGGVQGLLYLAGAVDLLGVARIFLSWPIYGGMLALTVWAVRRNTRANAT